MQQGSRLLRYLLWSFIWLGLAGGTAWANHIHMQEGPFGGIVLGVTVDRVASQVLYAVVFGGGVFKSTSGGQLWTSIHQGLENARVLCLAQDLVTPSTLYLCTDAGVLKTSATGDCWLPARQGIEERNVRAIVFDPQRPARLFAGTDAGVYRSDDGGESWIPTRQGLSDLDVRALGIDPLHSNIMYAATFAGMFRSLDGGHTWTDLSQWVLNPRPIGSTPQESERSPAPATSHSSGE